MKKQFKLMALASVTMLFAACSQENLLSPQEQLAQAPENNAIQFGTYMGKTGTRTVATGSSGAITTTALLQAKGFGVFAYYTNANTYDQKNGGSATLNPNFMWNQKVRYDTDHWTYEPVKYWPNEVQNGTVDNNQGATSTNGKGGNLTFFAYAPYVLHSDASTGAIAGTPTPDEGITAFSANTVNGDPTINYTVPAAGSDIVDLLWGTKGSTSNNVNGSGNLGVTSTALSYVAAPVASRTTWTEDIAYNYTMNADLTKQKIDGKVDFAFKHALAKFGGFQGLKIITDVNTGLAVSGGALQPTDRVTVKSISITAKAKNATGTKYYDVQKGTFNLATGKWAITGSEQDAAPTGTSFMINTAMMNAQIAEPATVSTWSDVSSITGVPSTSSVDVYANLAQETQPVVFIPGTKPELTVTIDYIVRTKDDNLNNGYSEVEQVITKTITFAETVELNKYYKLLIHLGLEDINFTATATDWENSGAAETDVNLPINVAP